MSMNPSSGPHRIQHAIVHYHEIALKGRNREYFEQHLVRNIQSALKDLAIRRVENLRSRIRIQLPSGADHTLIQQRLTRVCGIANFSLGRTLPLNLAEPNFDSLTGAIIEELRQKSFSTFRVTAKRADKRLTLTSMDVERAVGAALCQGTGKTVSLKDPDCTVYVELLTRDVYFSVEKIQGAGGMPVGVSGK